MGLDRVGRENFTMKEKNVLTQKNTVSKYNKMLIFKILASKNMGVTLFIVVYFLKS